MGKCLNFPSVQAVDRQHLEITMLPSYVQLYNEESDHGTCAIHLGKYLAKHRIKPSSLSTARTKCYVAAREHLIGIYYQ